LLTNSLCFVQELGVGTDAGWFVRRIKVVARTFVVFYSYVSARKLDKLFVCVLIKDICNKFGDDIAYVILPGHDDDFVCCLLPGHICCTDDDFV